MGKEASAGAMPMADSGRRWGFASAALQALGVYLFASGFLCTRQELADKASCADPQAACAPWLPCNASYAGPRGCDGGPVRTLPEFRFVVLLVVDALRFDFAPEFPTIAKSLAASPRQVRLCQFVADAPTTTMQRLKGLTTGGLPTFVDIGRSFDAGIDIQEDNWVHGATRAGHRVSVTGDDTWVSLFPAHRLTKAQPYPSLNVKDIDGCDDHVIRTLPDELAEAAELPEHQRSVIVGHFLGVDHIGHRFGIEHPEMRRKVADMDAVLNRTIQWAEEQKRLGRGDSLLLFFGDHGQTVTGDHGGATPEEVCLHARTNTPTRAPHGRTPKRALLTSRTAQHLRRGCPARRAAARAPCLPVHARTCALISTNQTPRTHKRVRKCMCRWNRCSLHTAPHPSSPPRWPRRRPQRQPPISLRVNTLRARRHGPGQSRS